LKEIHRGGGPLRPVFTLERFVWRQHASGWVGLPGADAVRTFPERAAAELTAREHEWDIRRRVNPFQFGGPALHYQTAFDAARLFDWCLDHGLEPPAITSDSALWASWWETYEPSFTALQRAALWDVLDRVRFFRVAETEPAAPMHLVALPHFENDPIPSMGWAERHVGSTPYMLVRSRSTADWLCHELYLNRLLEVGDYSGAAAEGDPWVIPDVDPFAPEEPLDPADVGLAVYAERRPLDFIGDQPPTPGRDVFVVLRRGWRIEEGGLPGSWRWSPTQARSCGTPVAAFGTLEAADAQMARLEAEARTMPSPFRFGTPHEWGTLHASGIWGVLSAMAPIVFTNQWTDYKASDRAWSDWWDAVVPSLTGVQIETVWSLFESLKFYEVVAVEYRD
jgi:hypothetical protein